MNNSNEKKIALDAILNMKKPEKTPFYQALGLLYNWVWLHVFVRKKSHRHCMKKASRVFALLKNPEFKTSPNRLFAYVRKIDPFVFEELLLLAFKARGLKVIHNKRYTGDGGIDGIVVLPTKHRIAVQAKRYQSHINVQHLRDFAQDLKNQGCSGGFFIHSGKSGSAVYQHLPPNIALISGENLHKLLVGY